MMFACLIQPLAAGAAPSISTHAEAAALIDVESGRLLYSQQGDKVMRIASLTKIMTAIVAIEHGKLTDKVKVGSSAYRKEGSSLYLKLGEEMTLENLLYGLMLRSGNDAATAIAEHVGGSLEGFVYLMNQKAAELGLKHSTFKNPHGLDEDGHRSSANDLAKLTAYALKNPVFAQIVGTKVRTAPNPYESWDYKWLNKNKMLDMYLGANGVKTGYTKLAGRCLVSSATRNGQQLAVVTLDDRDDWADHSRLLDYGFKYYPLSTVINKGDAAPGTEWVAGNSFKYPASDEERGKLTMKPEAADTRTLAYRLGERGTLHILLDGGEIGKVPLYEKGSPRLSARPAPAFGAGETDLYHSEYSRFLYFVQSFVRTLFTGSPEV
nr:D-alanyl-D-alanine carboxypeptidase family protein [Paenibacillus hamazuiensis]